jgi:hypothetical protein
MSRFIRLSILAVAAAALAACGGGAKIGGGKEGAAKALFQASQPAGKSGSSGQNILVALANAASVTGEATVNCASGGSVKVAVDISSVGNQSGVIKYNVEYKSCNQDGVNEFDGSMAMSLSLSGTATTAELALHLKGKIEISGDIKDFLDADITETIAIAATSATSGTVTVKLNVTIKTSENSYSYVNESLTITVDGAIPQDNGKS